MAGDRELLQGTLDVLVLKALTWGTQHGYGIARWIRDTSGEAILVEDRALYIALHRLETSGWVSARWGLSENNRKARFYRLTAAGRRALTAKAADWSAYADGMYRVLRAEAPG